MELKGPLGAINQVLVTVGIQVAFALGLPVPETPSEDPTSFEVQSYWRIVFALPIAFSVVQCLLLLTVFNYETPKFLKQSNKHANLNELMGKIYEVDRVGERIDAITIENGSQVQGVTYGETFCSPRFKVATLVGCCLSVLQQLSGINAVMFYSSKIFKDVGWSARGGTALVGFVNMVSTFFAIALLGSKVCALSLLRIRKKDHTLDPELLYGGFSDRTWGCLLLQRRVRPCKDSLHHLHSGIRDPV